METKKLTAKDLMIGDWVNSTFSDKPCKVQAIDLSEHGYGSVRVTGVDGVKDIISISPIPLTAEILEKNGWSKPASGRVWDTSNVTSFVLEEIDDGSFEVTTYTCSDWGGLCKIHYVHQLQNLLHACHEDKEIVL
jgi:hypothetical protein